MKRYGIWCDICGKKILGLSHEIQHANKLYECDKCRNIRECPAVCHNTGVRCEMCGETI